MVVASLMNVAFAVLIGLWLSCLFYKNITRGGRSKGAALSRVVFLVTWGFVAMSTGFIFSLIGYALGLINNLIAGSLSQPQIAAVLYVLHPFSIGLVVTDSVYPQFLANATRGIPGGPSLVFVAVAVYVLLAGAAVRKTIQTVARVAHGQGTTIVRHMATEFLVRVRKPIAAYVMKDLRVASKTPSVAFIFALPIFEVLIIGLNTSAFAVLRATSVLSVTLLGCFFTLFSGSVLLNTEGVGLGYTLSLPLTPSVILNAKSLVATAAYIPVPIVISVLLALKGTTSWILVLIPFLQILAVSAATTAQLSFFIRGYTREEGATSSPAGRRPSRGIGGIGFSMMSGADILKMAKALIVAAIIVAAPLLLYGGSFIFLHSHLISIGLMAAGTIAELTTVQAFTRRM
jgi:predicted permease